MSLKNFTSFLKNESLRKKFYVTIAIIVLYKLLSYLPVPGVNVEALAQIKKFLMANQWLSFFSALMWGWLDNFSIILMWLSPYINAMIIVQLLAVIIPYLENIKKEWESGQKKIEAYTKYLTVPLAFAQSYWMIILMNTLVAQWGWNIIKTTDFIWTVLPAMLFITAWTMLLIWLWDMISEYWIGNGTSMIIFAWVLAGVPEHILSYISVWNYGLLAGLTVATLAVIFVIIKFTEWYRKITLIYTKTWRSEQTYFPIRINQAWMVPIIFAVSIVTFPALIGQILSTRGSGKSIEIWQFLVNNFSMNNPSWLYITIYFLLVLAFSFFYISIVFNTEEIAENIQKRWGYVPGIRPGKETADYFTLTSTHLNLFGWSFLALIAVFPYIVTKLATQFGLFNTSWASRIDFLISWAWLIIVVWTILDLVRRINTELKSYDYKKYY